MSDTPKTDSIEVWSDNVGMGILVVPAREMRQVEKQLAEARAEIERLKRCCNCEYANHKLEICEHPDNEPETFMDGVCDLWSHNI